MEIISINKNIIKIKILIIFIIMILFTNISLYGYDLLYEAEPKNLDANMETITDVCTIVTPVQPYPDTITEYHNRTAEYDNEDWVIASAEDRDTTGGDYTFASSYYVFYKMSDPITSTYNSGFNTSSSNTTNNNIFYDSYKRDSGVPIAIKDGFDNINKFKGIPVNIPENQSIRTSGMYRVAKSDSNMVKLLRWKVITNNKQSVVINEYRLTADLVGLLRQKFTDEELIAGIRFSNVLNTQYDGFPSDLENYRSYMDTAWLYFQLTVGNGWANGGRGFTPDWPQAANGYPGNEAQYYKANVEFPYKKGTSVANEYDNILKIPFLTPKNVKREIYINHVDEYGNVITVPDFENKSLRMTIVNPGASNPRMNLPDRKGYQEHYTINGKENIEVKKSPKSDIKIGDTIYSYIGGEAAAGATLTEAKNLSPNSKYYWGEDTKGFTTSSKKKDDYVVINLFYSKTVIPPPDVLPSLEIVGRLEFINRNSEYINSTSGHDIDYIPSTKQLTPFAQSAYPYVVRALRYEPRNETKSSSATVTTYITYKWDIWTYSHDNSAASRKLTCTIAEHSHSSGCYNALGVRTCGKTAHTHTGIYGSCYSHQHTSACDWYKTTNEATTNKVFNYAVQYKHSWFQITNFKMYRISKLDVYDKQNNVGGTLFGGDRTYTITPSGTYESRFDNSRGKINKTLTVTFPSESYYLDSVYEQLAKPSGGTGTSSGTSVNSQATALSTANTKLGEVNHKIAADHENLTITYQYDNDYVELDGATDMLQRNYKTWSEHIIKETDTSVRNLDSTKTGTGQINGINLMYTSNLMSYMRPTTRLTTDSDFTPNYQTVPADEENGIRRLEGKIYYTIVSDSKYNVGANSFHSTDATYRLNEDLNLVDSSFTPQNKAYVNNDVNRVNVLTPANFGTFNLVTDQKVDHSTGAGNATILQKNAVFTITPTTSGSNTAGYNLSDTREFIKGFYFIFDFNIIYNGTELQAYDPIYIEGRYASITAKTTDSFGSGSADQLTNSIKIVAITTNINDALKSYFDDATYSNYNYMDNNNNIVRNTGIQNQRGLLSRSDLVSDSYHAIYKRITTKNLGRIFDFAVSDCTDLAFKDIFKTTTTGNINTPTGKSYYSGYKKWNLYSSAYNEMVDRTDIGGTPQTILPLGPYKNTNTKYVNAPKMGYRIAFDLKTTGYMLSNNDNNSRRVEVTPKYYYISKDGKTFDNNIKLYFKNGNGNYINFASSGYTIYYKPNDGYRYLRNSMYTDNFSLMSTKLEPLTVSSKIVLNNKSMSTNNTSFIQAWYGEFKLPNSTIAVSNNVGNPNNNVNNPYKDGYIGVIFDIKCIDSGGFTLSYDTSDKSSGSSVNTSQWDYEGFMNFKNPGSPTNTLRYQLEKDMWEIDNSRYQQVKGTVVLFDLDNRAANDFE
jgi:hypothetical protein